MSIFQYQKKKLLINKILLLVYGIATLIAIVNYLSKTRLPTELYLVFGVVQLAAVWQQLKCQNMLTAILGLCLTIMLLLAVVIERAKGLEFNFVLTASVYTPYVIAIAYNVLLMTSSLYHALIIWFVVDRLLGIYLYPIPAFITL